MISSVVLFPFPGGSCAGGWKFCQPRSWVHATEVGVGNDVYVVSGRGDNLGFFEMITDEEDFGYWGDSAAGVWTFSVRELGFGVWGCWASLRCFRSD